LLVDLQLIKQGKKKTERDHLVKSIVSFCSPLPFLLISVIQVAQAASEWHSQLAGQAHNMAPPTTPMNAVPYLLVGKAAAF
jgi:hypothetical protein